MPSVQSPRMWGSALGHRPQSPSASASLARTVEQAKKMDALMTVEHRSHLIEECHRRAAEARRLADTPGASLDERDDLLVVERRWLSLAGCFGGRIESAPPTKPYGANSAIRGPPPMADHELS